MAKKPTPQVKEGADETRAFVARFNIVADGQTIPPGGTIDLTREEFDELNSIGAIAGEWK